MAFDGVVLVDHDNIKYQNCSTEGSLGECGTWIARNSPKISPTILYRMYGGWFSDCDATPARWAAFSELSKIFPSVLRISGKIVRFKLEFADYVFNPNTGIYNNSPQITHTVTVRKSLGRSRVVGKRSCGEEDCERPRMAKWIRKRTGCPRTACPCEIGETFESLEQKQVDVHLATDLILMAHMSTNPILLLSDDVDFSPAMLAATRIGGVYPLGWARSNIQERYLDHHLSNAGVDIFNVGIQR